MRIFLDTNVLVAAFIARGLCADLFREILKHHELVIGEVVLKELKDVLLSKIKVPEEKVKRILSFLGRREIVPEPERALEIEITDKSNKWILASVLQVKVDLFVTGDKEFLGLEKVGDVKIVTPRDCWFLLGEVRIPDQSRR